MEAFFTYRIVEDAQMEFGKETVDHQVAGNVICIVLCSYNGERFLAEQLGSILDQSMENWVLLARDDGSTDGSAELLKSYADKDARIAVIEDSLGNLGAGGNFRVVLEEAFSKGYSYFALSDQDDVWSPDKLEALFKEMREAEGEQMDTPILVHSDAEVVDESLRVLSPSFMRYQRIFHDGTDPLPVLLAQNFVTGCTVMVNRRVLDLALPIPEEAMMHDWWLALNAAAFGEIRFVNKPLIKYRQHERNTIGAKTAFSVLASGFRQFWNSGMSNFQRSLAQAKALSQRMQKLDLKSNKSSLVANYAAVLDLGRVERLRLIAQKNIRAQFLPRNILFRIRLLLS